jgi:hypothetical protein
VQLRMRRSVALQHVADATALLLAEGMQVGAEAKTIIGLYAPHLQGAAPGMAALCRVMACQRPCQASCQLHAAHLQHAQFCCLGSLQRALRHTQLLAACWWPCCHPRRQQMQ